MGFWDLLSAMGITAVTTLGVAWLLTEKLINNRLAKDLKQFDAKLTTAVNAARAEVEAQYKERVELVLGDAAADRAYRSEARKRLYQALGPLRFQLLVAAAEWTNRVARIGLKSSGSYDMSLQGHFLRSTAYRLLRLLAIAELIERQSAFADFMVDPDMRTLLKFKRQAGQCLSSADVSMAHPDEDWTSQKQHVFSDVLSNLAAAMIVKDAGTGIERVVRFDEFQRRFEDDDLWKELHPVPALMVGFTPNSRPILWLRMLALSQLCIGLLEAQGEPLGLEVQPINLNEMLHLSDDAFIMAKANQYVGALKAVTANN
ncbi:hypothetical protein A4F85_09795 [Delftia sp. GW456-R20]|uniref:hypothetical protein n=1 Tax=Delftia sp. GW456-R20 TaxID=1827145 RepID=UPI0007B4ABA0|nr:hypothetical protein [Delftia sp. GW456-R20]KZK28110.1 hypothetical protein A4F85_09795 [Delftia sp. GW456-R20]